MWGHVAEITKASLRAESEAAERRLAKVEMFLFKAFSIAAREAREMFADDLIVELIEDSGGLLAKAESMAKPKWLESLVAPLALLGRPAVYVWVKPAAVLAASRPVLATGRANVPPAKVMEAIAAQAARGIFMAPAVMANIGGGRWEFLEGRARFSYAASVSDDKAPIAIPAADLKAFQASFKDVDVSASPAPMPGGLVSPRDGAAGRPSHLVEAIEAVSFHLANRFASAVLAAASSAGEVELRRIGRLLSARARAAKLDLSVDFSTPNYNAVNELQLSSLGLIREVTDAQQQAILGALRDGVELGINPKDMARVFRNEIGLTTVQNQYIENYRRALMEAHTNPNAAANALGRQLRDGRFDRSVTNALNSGKALSLDQIEKMVDRYRERWITYRAQTIARTQALRAVHMGELAAWEASIANGDIQANEITATWNTARDDRVRASHVSLNGQQRPHGKPFTTAGGRELRFPGDPLAPAEEVINCRCVLTRQISEQPLAAGQVAGQATGQAAGQTAGAAGALSVGAPGAIGGQVPGQAPGALGRIQGRVVSQPGASGASGGSGSGSPDVSGVLSGTGTGQAVGTTARIGVPSVNIVPTVAPLVFGADGKPLPKAD